MRGGAVDDEIILANPSLRLGKFLSAGKKTKQINALSAKGDNIGDVSNQLGHHSVKLTLDTYYHWIPGKKKSEVDALDNPALKLPNAPQVHPTPKMALKKGQAINA
jgi:hypothetical protein